MGGEAAGGATQTRLPAWKASFSFIVYVVDADSGTRYSVIAKAGTVSVLPSVGWAGSGPDDPRPASQPVAE